jgi:hypothetical protein
MYHIADTLIPNISGQEMPGGELKLLGTWAGGRVSGLAG